MKISEYLELSEREREAYANDNILGFPKVKDFRGFIIPGLYALPNGKQERTNITTTWEGMRLVVEKMESEDWELTILRPKKEFIISYVAFSKHDGKVLTHRGEYAHFDCELPEAVCIAALLALGKLEE